MAEKPASIVEPSTEAMETVEALGKSAMENQQMSARRARPGGEVEGNLDKRARVAGV